MREIENNTVCLRASTETLRFPFGQLAYSNDVTCSEMKMKKNMDFCPLNIHNSALSSLIIQMRE